MSSAVLGTIAGVWLNIGRGNGEMFFLADVHSEINPNMCAKFCANRFSRLVVFTDF